MFRKFLVLGVADGFVCGEEHVVFKNIQPLCHHLLHFAGEFAIHELMSLSLDKLKRVREHYLLGEEASKPPNCQHVYLQSRQQTDALQKE